MYNVIAINHLNFKDYNETFNEFCEAKNTFDTIINEHKYYYTTVYIIDNDTCEILEYYDKNN